MYRFHSPDLGLWIPNPVPFIAQPHMLFIETIGSLFSREVSWSPPSSGPEAPILSHCHFKVSIPLEIAMLPPVREGARGEGAPGGRIYFPWEVW